MNSKVKSKWKKICLVFATVFSLPAFAYMNGEYSYFNWWLGSDAHNGNTRYYSSGHPITKLQSFTLKDGAYFYGNMKVQLYRYDGWGHSTWIKDDWFPMTGSGKSDYGYFGAGNYWFNYVRPTYTYDGRVDAWFWG